MLATIFGSVTASAEGVDRLEPCEDWRPYIVAAIPEAGESVLRAPTERKTAFESGISINTVGNLAANAYRKLDVHGAAAAAHAQRDAHFYCGTRVDFGPIRERLKASRSTSSCL